MYAFSLHLPYDNPSKIFVLDTNVLLHDHKALGNFQENDLVIPIVVIEELDRFKKVTSKSITMQGNFQESWTEFWETKC